MSIGRRAAARGRHLGAVLGQRGRALPPGQRGLRQRDRRVLRRRPLRSLTVHARSPDDRHIGSEDPGVSGRFRTRWTQENEMHMRPSGTAAFVLRQIAIVVGAVVVYFGVRGLTEGEVATAERNAGWVLDLERSVGIAVRARVAAGPDRLRPRGDTGELGLHLDALAGARRHVDLVDRRQPWRVHRTSQRDDHLGPDRDRDLRHVPRGTTAALRHRVRRHRDRAVACVSRVAAAGVHERLRRRSQPALRVEPAGRDRLVPRSVDPVGGGPLPC